MRSERVHALLEAELDALPPCEERAEVCANGQDENCDGTADEGCPVLGAGGAGGAEARGGAASATGATAAVKAGAAGAAGSSAGASGESVHAGASGASGDGSAANDDSGCGCRATTSGSPPAWLLIGLAGALAAARRWRGC